LNLVRFEKFLSSLSTREMDRFDDIYSDNKWLEGKTAKKKRTKAKGASGFETVITDTPGTGNPPFSLQMKLRPKTFRINCHPHIFDKFQSELLRYFKSIKCHNG
jgi:hypothetical protein